MSFVHRWRTSHALVKAPLQTNNTDFLYEDVNPLVLVMKSRLKSCSALVCVTCLWFQLLICLFRLLILLKQRLAFHKSASQNQHCLPSRRLVPLAVSSSRNGFVAGIVAAKTKKRPLYRVSYMIRHDFSLGLC